MQSLKVTLDHLTIRAEPNDWRGMGQIIEHMQSLNQCKDALDHLTFEVGSAWGTNMYAKPQFLESCIRPLNYQGRPAALL